MKNKEGKEENVGLVKTYPHFQTKCLALLTPTMKPPRKRKLEVQEENKEFNLGPVWSEA